MGPAAAAGGGGDEEPVDVPGALGGVLVEEPRALLVRRGLAPLLTERSGKGVVQYV